MPKQPIRTQFTIKALDMAEVFSATLGTTGIPGATTRRPELTAPEGQSTGGGAMAVQSITLKPEDPSAGTLVAGTVNGAAMTAELRGYPYLNATYQMRYHGKHVDISADAYQKFVERTKAFFEGQGYRVSVKNVVPEAARRHYTQSMQKQSSSSGLLIIILLFVVAGAGVATYFLLFQ